MKVLFTGTASSHCKRSPSNNFFSALSDVVSEFAEVTWAAPKLSWTKEDLDNFDFIIFGLTPPTALSSNKIYGAMHVLGLMYHSPKLRLVIDSPQMWQYKNSLEAVKRNVDVLFSPFFSRKTGYVEAKGEKRKYIDLASSYLSSGYWPKTYYPALPWSTNESTAKALKFVSADRLRGFNLDSTLILPEPYTLDGRVDLWSVEDTKRSWYNDLKPTLRFGDIDIKSTKLMTDLIAGNRIRTSLGLIIPPQERKVGTWWSYKYIQGLNSNTPVVTVWQESRVLGPSWMYLPYQIEDMSESERRSVARNQLESYYEAIPSKYRITEEIRNEMLDSSKERI